MFLPDLLACAEAMKAAIKILEPEMLRRGSQREVLGQIVLGTARGDIHDIGKNLVATILSASGFQIFDLGTSVTPEQFVAKAREVDADIVDDHYGRADGGDRGARQMRAASALQGNYWRGGRDGEVGGRDPRGWVLAQCQRHAGAGQGSDGASGGSGMRPRIQLLSAELIERILGEAFQLLSDPGVRVAAAAVELLRAAGVEVRDGVARLPEALVRQSVASVPRDFFLYNRRGEEAVHYGGDEVHFDPGSCCVQVLDRDRLEARPSETRDLVQIVQVTEMLSQFAAQSTAVVCNDAPGEIGDLYRLWVVLRHSNKPVVTGSFSPEGLPGMIELLAADRGGRDELRRQPRAIFDVCPSPPLNWSEFGSRNLLDLARAGVPTEIVAMPLAGGTAPVTLAGSVTQHAAEELAGITLHQLAGPGAPVVWGGAPAIFDMRTGGNAWVAGLPQRRETRDRC
jgi:trimethylamine--corrinoid protein Co-methyltransferase